MVRMPPKKHKDMKLGKHKPKGGGSGMVKLAEKAPLQLDRMRLWKIIRASIIAPYSQIVPTATLTSSSQSSHSREFGSALSDAEGGKPFLAEK